MIEKNIVGTYLLKDAFPEFGYESPAAAAIPAPAQVAGAETIDRLSSFYSRQDPIAQWRGFSEALRERRLARAAKAPAGHPEQPLPLRDPGADSRYQEEYEQDMTQIHEQTHPMVLGLQRYLALVQHPIPDQAIKVYEAPDEADQPAGMTVAQVMTRKICCVLPSTSIEQVASLCNRRGFSGVPVVDAQHSLVGIVTLSDILRQLLSHDTLSTFDTSGAEVLRQKVLGVLEEPVRNYMNTQVITVTPETPIDEACALMSLHGIRRVIVTRGTLVRGVFSSRDAVTILARAKLSLIEEA